MGLATSTVDLWRNIMLAERPSLCLPKYKRRPTRRHGNGNAFSKLRSDRRQAAFLLYADGSDDGEIARAIGISKEQVWKWRQALYLPAVRPRGGVSRGLTLKRAKKPPGPAISPLTNPTHARIMSAIGRALPPDLTDDAASDMWLAMLEGRLSVEQIEAQARRFRGRVIADYASRYGPTSMDEDLTGDGFRLLDVLRDDRSSDWLERSGATVW
ncbi:helix-turn-helix domain-containing protein [Sphingomonas sp. BK235]|uniref:helix-turn-helix domain-containing protein n=1 Tax=Sphingomonas sp. BK235 TaxID=2512131 RepID=UPI001044B293|nr:helix-turn-helix domain-containing protein [Sphingomonas sp. BK235]